MTIRIAAFFLLVLAFAGCNADRIAIADKDINVYGSHEDAGREHSLNRPTPKSMGRVKRGERVVVVSDVLGKDYWACRIRLGASATGWVLCTSLRFEEPAAAN